MKDDERYAVMHESYYPYTLKVRIALPCMTLDEHGLTARPLHCS